MLKILFSMKIVEKLKSLL